MTPQNKTPPGRAGLDINSMAGNDVENSQKPVHAQEAIAALQRDYIAEALRIAAIKTAHAANDVLLGDDVGAEREIRLAVSHLQADSAAFREMQRSIDGPADALLTRPEAGGAL
jgi:hypothetical protein